MARKPKPDPPPLPDAVENDPLWQRLKAYEFDPEGAGLKFAARLARDNGWPQAYADAAIEEYRRFCYLAQTADHMVAPSDEVDQVWHLHLLYSESYWDEFCAKALGARFHHVPARGGREDADTHRQMYAKTLSAYEATFGAPPARRILARRSPPVSGRRRAPAGERRRVRRHPPPRQAQAHRHRAVRDRLDRRNLDAVGWTPHEGGPP